MFRTKYTPSASVAAPNTVPVMIMLTPGTELPFAFYITFPEIFPPWAETFAEQKNNRKTTDRFLQTLIVLPFS